MKCILILTNSIIGLHSFRKEVMKSLIDAGYRVFISYPNEDVRSDYFREIGCDLLYTPFERRGKNPLKDMQLCLVYVKLIKRVKPLAVLTYTIKPNIYGGLACALCGVPQLANITGLGDAIENDGLLSKLSLKLYRLGLRNAFKVFFQNKSNLEFALHQRMVREQQVHLLPGSGVNTDYHVYQEYPLDDCVRFLLIARLLKTKGVEEYFGAAKIMRTKYPQTEFQILGACEGNYAQQLEILVKKGVLNYLGETSDVRPYIGKVHCTVMPSYHEGMSNVNLESEASGRPVITSDVPGCQETIEDGVTGFLVKARSSQSLAQAMERFIRLPYEEKKQMGIQAREKVKRDFDRQIVVNAYLDAIKELLP